MNAELYDAACAAAEFIKRNHPQAKEWDDVISYCAWYIDHGFMAVMHSEDGTIGALACGRPVNDPQDGNIPYKYCEDGSCIYIDFMAIKDHAPWVLHGFGVILAHRFGERNTIAYTRVSVHGYQDFLRNIGRINKIGYALHEPAETARST
jgi:hypothetical protein